MSAASGKSKRASASSLLADLRKRRRGAPSASPAASVESDPPCFADDHGTPISRPPPAQHRASARSAPRCPTSPLGSASSASAAQVGEIVVRLPADLDAFRADSFPVLEQLLLPSAEECLGGRTLGYNCADLAAQTFKNLQTVVQMCKAARRLEEEREALIGRERSATVQASEYVWKLKAAEGQLAGLRAELREKDAELARCRSDVAGLTSQLQGYREQQYSKDALVKDVGAYYTWLARIECMEEAARGDHLSWDAVKERADFEETYKEEPDFVVQAGEQEEGCHSPSAEVLTPLAVQMPVFGSAEGISAGGQAAAAVDEDDGTGAAGASEGQLPAQE
ncbi:hypothetical protein vseg_001894 [Gypsophila vaccaria]